MTSGDSWEVKNERLLTEIAVLADEDWDDIITMLEPIDPRGGEEVYAFLTMLSERVKYMRRRFNIVSRHYAPKQKEYYYIVQNYTYNMYKYLTKHYNVAATYLNIGIYENDLSERDQKLFKEKAEEN